MSNLPVSSLTDYINQLQQYIFDIQKTILPSGTYSFSNNLVLNNNGIIGASGISGLGGSIVLGTRGQINLVSASVRINGVEPVSGPSSAGDGNLVAFDTTTGKKIKDSGITAADIAGKLSLSGGSMTGPVDSAGVLSIGTITATGVNIGRSGQLNTLFGPTTIRQPCIYVNFPGSVNPTVTSNVVTGIVRSAALSGAAVDFTLDTSTGIVTYTGTVARSVVCIYHGGISYATAGYNLYMALIQNPGTPPVMPSADAHLWQTSTGLVSSIWNQSIMARFLMNPGDTIQLCFRNQSGPVSDVAFFIGRLSITAQFN